MHFSKPSLSRPQNGHSSFAKRAFSSANLFLVSFVIARLPFSVWVRPCALVGLRAFSRSPLAFSLNRCTFRTSCRSRSLRAPAFVWCSCSPYPLRFFVPSCLCATKPPASAPSTQGQGRHPPMPPASCRFACSPPSIAREPSAQPSGFSSPLFYSFRSCRFQDLVRFAKPCNPFFYFFFHARQE